MKYFFLNFLFLIVLVPSSLAQKGKNKFKFGDVKPEDFVVKDFPEAEQANAVYLLDEGESYYQGNNKSGMSVIYRRHQRILLRNKNAFDDLATQVFRLQNFTGYEELILNLDAATYKLENGKVVSTKLSKSEIFKEKVKGETIVKFTYPAIEEGCIIEFDYTEEDPYDLFLPGFSFQSAYPKIWTQYFVEIPNYYDFVLMKKGFLKPDLDSFSTVSKTYLIRFSNNPGQSETGSFTTTAVKHGWGYKNVPALKDEKYIFSYDDYRESISFQLSMTRFPQQAPVFHRKSWEDLVKELRKNEFFGSDLNKNNNWLDELLVAANAKSGTDLEKAKKLYEYIRDHYECIDDEAKYMSQASQKTIKSQKGNVADINLLLTLALRYIGLDANPSLLSTRDNGKPNETFPMLSDYNYVIAHLKLDGKTYCLDATNPLGFGQLMKKCYGGSGRLIADVPVIVPLYTDSIQEKSVSSVFLVNDTDGKLSGHYSSVQGPINSQQYRYAITKTGAEGMITNIKAAFPEGYHFSNEGVDSVTQLEEPLLLHFDFDFKFESDVVYFNPMMIDAITDNPFAAEQRFYPVEMDYCTDDTYILNMEVPAGYKIDEIPKSTRVTFNDDEGFYEYLVQSDGERIMLRSRIKINKATFQPEEYDSLREFYAFVVQKMQEQIVFKKQ